MKNSLGYTVIQDALYCSIVADSSKASGAKHVWKAESAAILKEMANGDWGVNEPIDTKLFGSVSVDKYDSVTGQTPQGEATLAGAKFQVINSSANSVMIGGKVIAPGGVCVELTTDTKGHASTGEIFPIGTYTIKETVPPPGFTLNTTWKQTFSVMTAIEYIRNAMKRVRKKDSSIILASQNIEDFLIPSIREFTKPLFSIPTHQFLFNAGQINPKEYMDALQVEPSEFELIKYPERGTCLYRCGNERYLLQVIAPEYKAAMFGKAGGR